jgi:hypothetical protein
MDIEHDQPRHYPFRLNESVAFLFFTVDILFRAKSSPPRDSQRKSGVAPAVNAPLVLAVLAQLNRT